MALRRTRRYVLKAQGRCEYEGSGEEVQEDEEEEAEAEEYLYEEDEGKEYLDASRGSGSDQDTVEEGLGENEGGRGAVTVF
jgi:hypothetical protein